MTSQSSLVQSVDQFPDSSGGSSPHPSNVRRAATTVQSLQEAASLKQDLFAPTYVNPRVSLEGISLRDSASGKVATISYGDATGRWLTISVGGRVKEGGAYVNTGSYDEVIIAGEPTTIITGGWVTYGGSTSTSWDSNVAIQAYTQRGGQLIVLDAGPGTDWERDEIIRILESLSEVSP